MNAVRWQCSLRPSRSARLANLAAGFSCVPLLLFVWPAEWHVLQALLSVAVLAESWRTERRLRQRCGELTRDVQGSWGWQGTRWYTARTAQWQPWGVLLTLQNAQGQRWRFWLMQDAMTMRSWRQLRAQDALSGAADQR
ncbi:protein YgfX [Pantoea eucrina]|uniref:protein YgfX n=1 Tax=Pantoea eucrina TaxID=472693 RepID=UPI002025B79B|nr:protein YgfX [Pantoea eucrina]